MTSYPSLASYNMPPKQYIAVVLYSLFAATAMADRAGSKGGTPDRQSATKLDELGRAHDEFGYAGDNGPDKWPHLFPTCGGRRQSPVNIVIDNTQPLYTLPLQVPDIKWESSGVRLTNNGHTVALTAVDSSSVQSKPLRGGPLDGGYTLENIHFHWGCIDAVGSEHAIDGSYFSMEMHMVFARSQWRSKMYRRVGDVVVLAAFLKMVSHDNQALQPVTSALRMVSEVGSITSPQGRVALRELLPRDTGHYLVYNGSLTTPPCTEVIKWIIFRQPVDVSRKQIAAFRKLKSPHGMLMWNRRPVQALNGRTVYQTTTQHAHGRTASDSMRIKPAHLLCAIIIQSMYYT